MIKISEIKTPNCMRCKSIEPSYVALKEDFTSKFPEKVEFKEYILNVDTEAKVYMEKYSLRAAPSFVVEVNGEEGKVVRFEDLREELSTVLQ